MTARSLMTDARPLIERQGLTLVGIAVANLESSRAVQLVLPFDGARGAAIDAAIDEIRDRFGTKAIVRAVLLGRDPGLIVPLLPD
jgi:DNA polymerase-4